MLFNSKDSISQPLAETIVRTVTAVDGFAQVRVDAPKRQIRIEGRLTALEAVAALGQAGCDVRIVDADDAVQAKGGGDCCGGCC